MFKILSVIKKNELGNLLKCKKKPTISEIRMRNDLEEILDISKKISEIKDSEIDSMIAAGCYIQKVKDLMENYYTGVFSKWLLMVFTNKVTPYNLINYYIFVNDLNENDLRKEFFSWPKRTCYKLCNRPSSSEDKKKVIQNIIKCKYSFKPEKKDYMEIEKTIDKMLPINNLKPLISI